jgi:hypothetical protein
VANRFGNATDTYNSFYAPRRLARGLGNLEGLLLLEDPLKSHPKAEVQAQLLRFVQEAEENPRLRNEEIVFTRWAHRVSSYLTYAISNEASVKFSNATTGPALQKSVGGALGVLDSMIDGKTK